MTVMLICSFVLHGWLLWAKPATEVQAPSAAVALKLGQLKLASAAEQSQPQPPVEKTSASRGLRDAMPANLSSEAAPSEKAAPEKARSKKAGVTDAPDLNLEPKPTPVASVSQAPTQTVERMDQQSLSDIPVLVERPAFASPPAAPVYPELARQRRQQGTVVVEVQLDASGTQVVRRLLRSSGVDSLDEAALRAVARWHFLPYRENGRARLSRVQLPIRFSL